MELGKGQEKRRKRISNIHRKVSYGEQGISNDEVRSVWNPSQMIKDE
jgi:hypothetical protein